MSSLVDSVVKLARDTASSEAVHDRSWAGKLEQVASLSLPTPKLESWRYTSPKLFKDLLLSRIRKAELSFFELLPGGEERPLSTLPAGIEVLMGAEAWSRTEALEAPYLGLDEGVASEEFYAPIPQLFPHNVALISITKAYENLFPILIRWNHPYAEGNGSDLELATGQLALHLHEGASLRLAQQWSGPKSLGMISQKIFIERGASLDRAELQVLPEDSIHLNTLSVWVNTRGNFSNGVLASGGKYTRHHMNAKLLGEEASVVALGMLGGSGQEFTEHPTMIDHVSGKTHSSQLFKGVFRDSSRATINGRVKIRQDAQQVDSSQYNKNLLLSQGASVQSKPELQVMADDVKAAHGATTGEINEEEIFYLRSRGLSRERAEELITRGYLFEVLDKFPNQTLAEWLGGHLDRVLKVVVRPGDEL